MAAGLLIAVGLLAAPAVFAQTNPNAQLVNLNFPCPTGMSGCAQLTDAATSSNPIGTFLNSFYQIALTISGLLALLMIVAGGVKYTISAGSADQQSDAKDMIISALYGVALLLGSYLILNTINPKITTLALPGDQYGAVATSSPSISLPNTECITLDPTTWDINNTSTLSATSSYAQLVPNGGAMWNGTSFANNNNDPTLNCAYRVGYVSSAGNLEINNDGRYYNESEVIPAGSQVWQYPYFSSSSDPTATNRCLIYAYEPQDSSSSPTMIDLNPNLQLCYPHNQSVGSSPNSNIPGTYTNAQAVQFLKQAGIGIWSSGTCSDQNNSHCTSLEGIPQSTINTLINIKNGCVAATPGCDVTVTGGTEVGHETHGPGKPVVDLRYNQALATYIYDNYDPNNPTVSALIQSRQSSRIVQAICTTQADNQAFGGKLSYNCGTYQETENHIHIQFVQ